MAGNKTGQKGKGAKSKPSKENVPPSASQIPGTGVLDSKATKSTARERARWTDATDAIMVTTLRAQKAEGNMTDNASWKSDAWTACERALAGSEAISGGCHKTAKICNTRWTAVSKLPPYCSLF